MFAPSVGLYTFSICMKAAERTNAALYTWASGGNAARLTINLTNGNVVASSGQFVNVAVVHLGSGWFNVQAQFAPNSTSLREFQLQIVDETGNNVYTGDGTSGIYIWGASLAPKDQSYQRVNTSTDYDTAGFPHYLRFDGVDDFPCHKLHRLHGHGQDDGCDRGADTCKLRWYFGGTQRNIESSQGTFYLSTWDTGGTEALL